MKKNLNEKLIRTFLRLAYHHSGINVKSYPNDYDMNLYLNINKINECNNPILEETFKSIGGRHV